MNKSDMGSWKEYVYKLDDLAQILIIILSSMYDNVSSSDSFGHRSKLISLFQTEEEFVVQKEKTQVLCWINQHMIAKY